MDLLVVLLIVGGVAFLLAIRAYRFFRRASMEPHGDTVGCSNGCVTCKNGHEHIDSGIDS